MFEKNLFQKKKSLIMRDFLSYLNTRIPGVKRMFVLAVITLFVFNCKFDYTVLLDNGFYKNVFLEG